MEEASRSTWKMKDDEMQRLRTQTHAVDAQKVERKARHAQELDGTGDILKDVHALEGNVPSR